MDNNIDLKDKLEGIAKIYLDLNELPEIKWSKGIIKKKYRKITFGTYDLQKNLIKIHPILKDENIPGFVLDFIIYHELLHYADREEIIRKRKSIANLFSPGKRLYHHKEFKYKEKEFPYQKEADSILKRIAKGEYKLKNS